MLYTPSRTMSRYPYYAYPPRPPAPPHNHLGMSMANTPVLVISRPMPQQPMPQLRRAKEPKQLRSPDRRKRYGMIFNTDPLQGMLEEDDDDSTWSMSRSRSSRRMLGSRHTSVRTRNSSPAQEIAARYRASHSGDLNASSSSVSYLQVPSVGGYTSATRSRTTSGETSISSTSGPRLRYRDSRAHAMDHAVSLSPVQPRLNLTLVSIRIRSDEGGICYGCSMWKLSQHTLPAAGLSQHSS